MAIGCKIYEMNRPDIELLNQFTNFDIANVNDNMLRRAALSHELRPLNSHRLIGPAFTVRVPAGDNLLVYKAMSLAKPGDILVIDAENYKDRAILGEIMVTYSIKQGIKGIVLYGSIRDYDKLCKSSIPVYCTGVSSNGPYKNGPGEINVPIQIGQQIISPGDIILGDSDGVISINPEDAYQLIEATRQTEVKEELFINDIELSRFDLSWVDKKLEELGCTYK